MRTLLTLMLLTLTVPAAAGPLDEALRADDANLYFSFETREGVGGYGRSLTIDLDAIDPESMPKDIVDDKLIQKHHAMPLYKRGNRLFVGLSDPMNSAAIDDIKFQTGLNTEAVLVEEEKLEKIIEEIAATRLTERGATRGDDRVSEAAMEDRKKQGYF